MKFPLILVNFKTYPEATGKKALELAKTCARVAKKFKVNILAAPQFLDLVVIKEKVKIPLLAQHFDAILPGRNTGFISLEELKAHKVSGSLLNHSEHKLKFSELKFCIARAKKLGLKAIVCASTPGKAKKIAALKPDMIAIEPPELIATGIPVSKAKPEIILRTTRAIKIPILCGAGITCREDVRRALELGAKGVLVSSAIVLAKDKEKALAELCAGLKYGP